MAGTKKPIQKKLVARTVVIDVAALGQAGGRKRAENLTPGQRSDSASAAAQARWDAYYAAHPEKLEAKKARARKAKKASRAGKKP